MNGRTTWLTRFKSGTGDRVCGLRNVLPQVVVRCRRTANDQQALSNVVNARRDYIKPCTCLATETRHRAHPPAPRPTVCFSTRRMQQGTTYDDLGCGFETRPLQSIETVAQRLEQGGIARSRSLQTCRRTFNTTLSSPEHPAGNWNRAISMRRMPKRTTSLSRTVSRVRLPPASVHRDGSSVVEQVGSSDPNVPSISSPRFS